MIRLRNEIGKTDRIHQTILEQLWRKWDGTEWQAKSEIARKNRAVDSGASSYTGGCVLVVEHLKRFVSVSYKLN
jgi:hypothetical protein